MFALVVLVIVIGLWTYFRRPKFGRLPGGERLALIHASPHYLEGEFRNLEPAPVSTGSKSRLASLYEFFFVKKEGLRPQAPLPAVKTDLKALVRRQDTVVWMGHSSFFVQLAGRRILIDPVFSGSAAPVPFVNRAFPGTGIYGVEDIPQIDFLLITHDHWDHLDHPTIKALAGKVAQVVCGLGVGAHLERWGYSKAAIREADWFTTLDLEADFKVHVLPTRHFSGRWLTRNKSLWVSFALESPERRLFFSGDSGYGGHFATIGQKFDGFDLVVLDTGQYDPGWAHIHMFPEEAAQAATDLRAKAFLPAHIGRFSISNHTWNDPFNRITTASEGSDYQLLTPMIGEPLNLPHVNQRFSRWWEDVQ